jgi:DNA-binding GntR family transcriptional regulator
MRTISARIADGTYTPGDRLHIGLLADELDVYRAAVSRALALLAEQGTVVRYPGHGWFVA